MTTVIWKSDQGSELPERRRMLIEAVGWQVRPQSHIWSPPTDVFETNNAYIVRVEVAGMRQQDFSVQIENNYLKISGARADKPEHGAYHQMEVRFGEFSSIVVIPGPVDIDSSGAEYEDGFLTVTLPKALSKKIKAK
jgi:HSP20 family protein